MDRVEAEDFAEYCGQLGRLLRHRDLSKAASAIVYLSVRDDHVRAEWFDQSRSRLPEYMLTRNIEDSWQPIVKAHITAANALLAQDPLKAFDAQSTLVKEFRKTIITKSADNFWLPILDHICSDLRYIADLHNTLEVLAKMDIERKAEAVEHHTTYYERAAAPIMDCYRGCVSDSRTDVCSKRLATLNLTNHLFRLYFKINKLNLLKPLIRQIEENSKSIWDTFQMPDKVTYRFFMGRKCMFDGDMSNAEKYLEYALRNCPDDYELNRRSILIYLIPVMMFRGKMPRSDMLVRYRLEQYSEIVAAVYAGNLRAFERALEKNEYFFISSGLFLMLEKLKIIACRNLFRVVAGLINDSRVPLKALETALKFTGVEDVDADETECLTANLIAQGRIKGYISHQHQILVLSKKDPFPMLT